MTIPPQYFGSAWGHVPMDGDVVPFSMINPIRGDTERTNRRHHFVSVSYMKEFANAAGRIQAYRYEAPEDPHPTTPRAVAFERDYYSQTLPEGRREHHRFEDLWNCIETVWPKTVTALAARRLSPAISLNVLGMAAIMHARVPAARDRHALMFETKLRAQCKIAEERNVLQADLRRYAGQFDTSPVGINPHETLTAMRDDFMAMGDLCFRLGFEVVHNATDTPFITSDNPVCLYDPNRSVHARRPYEHPDVVELIFPVSSRMVLRGCSKRRPTNTISRHRIVSDVRKVRQFNRTVAQFSYRLTIAQDRSSDDLIRHYARKVPTITTEVLRHEKEVQIIVRNVFGPRPVLSPFIDTRDKAERIEVSSSPLAGAEATPESGTGSAS